MIYILNWAKWWQPWRRCKARGRVKITKGIVRCDLVKTHEGDCVSHADDESVRFATMWTGFLR